VPPDLRLRDRSVDPFANLPRSNAAAATWRGNCPMISRERKRTDRDRIDAPLEPGFARIVSPFQEFVRSQLAGGVLLIGCTIAALVLANSGLAHFYESLLHTSIGFHVGDFAMEMSVRHWINDLLMAMFFFVLGLEIKREILVGDLRDPARSRLLIATAFGGMFVPALLYALLNAGESSISGWGIPMATDTAFAVAVLALLRGLIPKSLVTYLAALAIVDDIGAVAVIALFYTDSIAMNHLLTAGAVLGVLLLLNLLGVRRPLVYFLGGVGVWLAVLHSGVHATVAGVLVAFVTPARPEYSTRGLLRRLRRAQYRLGPGSEDEEDVLADTEKQEEIERVHDTARMALTPLQRWERALERPVALLVMPVFALANAGIAVDVHALADAFREPVTLGIVAGLVVGKPLGIFALCWIGVRFGLGRLPEELRTGHVLGLGLIGGMGFTMSIFIAGLSFGAAPEHVAFAKTGVLFGSLCAGTLGFCWLWWYGRRGRR
jgi:NhaA family Na+:H+ antiporter